LSVLCLLLSIPKARHKSVNVHNNCAVPIAFSSLKI
jgi:hypothetical protein